MRGPVAWIAVAACACATVVTLLCSAPAVAATGAWWYLGSASFPTQMEPGGTGEIVVSAVNRGYETASGANAPIVLADKLPAGVEATAIEGRDIRNFSPLGTNRQPMPACSFTAHEAVCSYTGDVLSYARFWMVISVSVSASAAASETSQLSVSGAELPGQSSEHDLDLAGGEPTYGLETFELSPEDDTGQPATQAGAHPFQLTTTVDWNKTARFPFLNPDKAIPLQPALPKEVNVKLPTGLIGNPTPFPQCTAAQFTALEQEDTNECPQDTAVGFVNIVAIEPLLFGVTYFSSPIYNLVPEHGEPARFGFTIYGAPVYLDTSVRTGSDYGVTVHVGNISQVTALLESEVTFWGVPGDPRHDNSRGWWCGSSEAAESFGKESCKLQEEQHPQPLLVMPTSCTGPMQTTVETASWKEPKHLLTYGPSVALPALDGCNKLNFEPEVKITPSGTEGSTASGLNVDLHVPQSESLSPTGLSESNVKDTTVTLPEGLVLNPSAADGLLSCSLEEISLATPGSPTCPEAAKVGTVTIHTPLLPEPLIGAAYLAAQEANPFGSLVALYVVAEDPQAGVVIKLAGEVQLGENGRITSTFENTPELPFEDFELDFFGGDRSPLATPASCGSYTTTASLTPWSETAPVTASSTFLIKSGPNGSSCASQLGFAPTLTGGTSDTQAAGFSPLITTMSRNDGEQPLKGVKLTFPKGLMATLSEVETCGEAQADAGTCGPSSLIGHTIVSVGIGGDPFSVTGGRVYITGPYEGAPFGLSIVEPAVAGPFNLGTVVVRAKVEVNPITAQLTVTTDPSGPYSIPTILDGIPLQIRHVNVTVDRERFTFDPTNCEKAAITSSITSTEGATSNLSVPFQVANCGSLPFKPSFAVSTSAKTSRKDGASLKVKLDFPKEAFGKTANVGYVQVKLPKQLPSRLSTLQKACTSAQFEANPAGCPQASVVGHAKAVTPVLPVPLEGPAYFVSNGSQKFPELVLVLQGDNVTITLHGETFISKAGITSSTFETVPDAPFSTFELTLPEGPDSALAANSNLCNKRLEMPTKIIGQNNAVIEKTTIMAVEGCGNALTIDRHKVKGSTLDLRLTAPQAGKLTATGTGLTRASASAKGREEVTLKLKEHRQGKLVSKVAVAFTPSGGANSKRKRETKTLTVRFK
ncbi:MAG TPA: hypothetical protein VGF95_15735 [Solirubrobacteraceae bacterium]